MTPFNVTHFIVRPRTLTCSEQ